MGKMTGRSAVIAAMALLAGTTSAQVADLTVDGEASGLNISVSVPSLSLSDSDSSSLSGTVQIELDSYGAPTGISMVDFDVDADSSIDLAFSLGFLGSASVSIGGVGATYAGTMPTAFASIDAMGNFTIAEVPINMTGSGTASGSGLLSAFDGTVIDLASFGTVSGDLSGTVQISDGVITLNSGLTGSGSQTVSGVEITASANITLVAVGPVPAVACVGDIADDFGVLGSDNQVSFGDFLALLGLVGPCPGGTPGCTGDIADDFGVLGSDGQVSFGDFLSLLGLVGPCP